MFGLNLALGKQTELSKTDLPRFDQPMCFLFLDQFPSNTFLATLITQRLNAPGFTNIPVGGRCNWAFLFQQALEAIFSGPVAGQIPWQNQDDRTRKHNSTIKLPYHSCMAYLPTFTQPHSGSETMTLPIIVTQ